MMKNKFIRGLALVAAAVIGISGCKWEGTTADFTSNARNGYVSEWDNAPEYGVRGTGTYNISASGSIDNANEKAIITVTIVSKGKLDEKSIGDSMGFYKLSSAANANLVKVRGAKLSSSIKKIDTTPSTNTTTTEIDFVVDAANGKEAQIAFVADATKLKDKAGNLILNGNGNEKCGEESDSYIKYIGVSHWKDGDSVSSPETVVGQDEVFAPTFSFGNLGMTPEYTDGKYTGAMELRLTPAAWTVGEETIRPEAFKAELNKMYVFRTLAIGANSWTETPVTNWEWSTTNNRYEAKTAAIAYGTRYELLTKSNNNVKWEAAKGRYGHTPVVSYRRDKTTLTDNGAFYNVQTSAPAWISDPDDPDNRDSAIAGTFPTAGRDYDLDDYTNKQDAILDISWRTNAVQITIIGTYLQKNIRFGTFTDFVITDNKLTKIKTKAPVAYQEDDKGDVYSIIIELEDKNLSTSNLKVWVGEGTTIKGNKVYTNQVKFGTPKIEATDTLTGYTLLTANTTT